MDHAPLLLQPTVRVSTEQGIRVEQRAVLSNGETTGATPVMTGTNEKSLRELIASASEEILGEIRPVDGRFPLDIRRIVSHTNEPNNPSVPLLFEPITVPRAVYLASISEAGFFLRGFIKDAARDTLLNSTVPQTFIELMNRVSSQAGQCYFIPPNEPFAAIGNVDLVEITEGGPSVLEPVPLPLSEPISAEVRSSMIAALARRNESPFIDPTAFEARQHTASYWTTVTSLVRCDTFTVERVRMSEGLDQPMPYDAMVVWVVLEGKGTIEYSNGASPVEFVAGDTVIIPAALRDGKVRTNRDCMWLEISVPVSSSLSGFDRPERERPIQQTSALRGPVQIRTLDRHRETE